MHIFSRMLHHLQFALLGWLSSVAGILLALCSTRLFEPLLCTITQNQCPPPPLFIYKPAVQCSVVTSATGRCVHRGGGGGGQKTFSSFLDSFVGREKEFDLEFPSQKTHLDPVNPPPPLNLYSPPRKHIWILSTPPPPLNL